MRNYIVTPWKNDEELLMVRRLLFGSTRNRVGEKYVITDQCSQAINLINAWKCRGRVPHAMDATALLIEARLFASKGSSLSKEKGRHRTQTQESPTDGLIRALYAAAFSRFVTGFCDSRQTSNHKQTMYEVAATIGMPVTFVDLRHECAHADPPSLRRLERSVDQALDWIWEIYWTRLSGEGEDEPTSSENEFDLQNSDDEVVINGVVRDEDAGNELEKQQLQDSFRAVLKKYLTTRKDIVFRRRGKSHDVSVTQLEESSIRSTYKELAKMCDRKANRFRALQSVLLEVKIMLPSTDATSDETMNTAFHLWDSLLQYITQRQSLFLRGLVRTMLAALNKALSSTSGSPLHNKFSTSTVPALYAWLSHILMSKVWLTFLQSSGSGNGSGSNSKSEIRIHQQIVSASLLTPNPLTVRLAHEIVSSGSPSLRRDWAPAVNACLPLLEEWESGPERISGNGNVGSNGRLKVLEMSTFDVPLLPDDDDDVGDYDDDDVKLPERNSNCNRQSNSQSDKNSESNNNVSARSKSKSKSQHTRRQQEEIQEKDSEMYSDLAMHGWKTWTGKWTPTPIGIVCKLN